MPSSTYPGKSFLPLVRQRTLSVAHTIIVRTVISPSIFHTIVLQSDNRLPSISPVPGRLFFFITLWFSPEFVTRLSSPSKGKPPSRLRPTQPFNPRNYQQVFAIPATVSYLNPPTFIVVCLQVVKLWLNSISSTHRPSSTRQVISCFFGFSFPSPNSEFASYERCLALTPS